MQSTELTSTTHDPAAGGGLASELPPLHADDEGVLVFMRATFAKAELDSVFTVTADDASNFLAKRKLRTVGELRRAQSQGRLGSILGPLVAGQLFALGQSPSMLVGASIPLIAMAAVAALSVVGSFPRHLDSGAVLADGQGA